MRRARALSQIGEVRIAKGDADGAVVALGESLALAKRGVERQPSRTEWLATLGATHFWIGYAHWNRNALDAALKEFTAYREIAGRMVKSSVTFTGAPPSIDTFQSEMSIPQLLPCW